MKFKRKALSSVAAIITASALVACGSNGDSVDSGGSQSDRQQTTDREHGGAKEASRELTIAVDSGAINVESNNPWNASSGRSFGYTFVTMEPLAILNPLEPGQLTPWLADAYEWNSDFTQLTVTIREGVLWSDGVEFTTDDVVFTFELIRDTEGIPSANRPVSIEAQGNQVIVTYDRSMIITPHGPLQTLMVPRHFVEGVEEPETATLLGMPGTGPYVKTQFTPMAVTLEARDDWWGGELAVDTLHFVSFNDNTSLATALIAGQVDWSQGNIPNVNAFLDADPANVFWTPTALDTDVLFINHTRAPFDSLPFRRAVNLVVDRAAHAEIVLDGNAPVLTSVTGLTPGAGQEFISPAFADMTFSVDLDQARHILEEAGYTGVGDRLIDPQGNPVVLDVAMPADWGDFVTAGSLVVNAISALGADVSLNTMDGAAWWTARAEGDFVSVVSALAPEAVIGFTPFQQTMCSQISAPLGENAQWNFGRFQSDQADQLITTFLTTTVEAEREAALTALQEIYVEQVPVIPLGVRPLRSAFHTRNFSGWPTDDNPYAPMQTLQSSVLLVLNNLTPVMD